MNAMNRYLSMFEMIDDMQFNYVLLFNRNFTADKS